MSIRASVVDNPLVAPNCSGSSLWPISFSNHSPMMVSKCLDSMEVKDMVRKSLSTLCGACALGMGWTFALFQIEGNVPSRMDELKMAQMGYDIEPARSQRIRLGIPSGPGALFTLVLISFSSVK